MTLDQLAFELWQQWGGSPPCRIEQLEPFGGHGVNLVHWTGQWLYDPRRPLYSFVGEVADDLASTLRRNRDLSGTTRVAPSVDRVPAETIPSQFFYADWGQLPLVLKRRPHRRDRQDTREVISIDLLIGQTDV